jgi:hypothetical protein
MYVFLIKAGGEGGLGERSSRSDNYDLNLLGSSLVDAL